jgi:hypothetical protein
METIYKCSYTGKVFTDKEECLNHEYRHGGKREEYFKLVEQFLDYIKSQGIKVISAKYDARILEEFDLRTYENKFLTLTLEKSDGEVVQYHRNSDHVGDGRYSPVLDSLERMISDFEKEFVIPDTKSFEGWLSMYTIEDNHSAGELDGMDIMDILWTLDEKKIRIEEINDNNGVYELTMQKYWDIQEWETTQYKNKEEALSAYNEAKQLNYYVKLTTELEESINESFKYPPSEE